MQPLVSIIVPVYNAEPWLAETLDCAVAQTWPHQEIIVVDDGSSDRSLEIAQQYESRGVKLLSQPNSGVCAARNLGVRESRGDYIQYLDADDFIAPDKIERQLALVPNGEQDYILAAPWARFEQDPAEAEFIPETLWGDRGPVDWVITAWKLNQFMNPGAWLTPRKIVEAIGPWNEEIIIDEDGEYFCRAVLASQGVRFCWEAKAYYRWINRHRFRVRCDRAYRSRFLALELCQKHLLAIEPSPRARQACANRYQQFFHEVYPQVPKLCDKAELRVRELGGSDVKPAIGSFLKPLSAIIGWRNAKKVQKFAYDRGWQRRRIPS